MHVEARPRINISRDSLAMERDWETLSSISLRSMLFQKYLNALLAWPLFHIPRQVCVVSHGVSYIRGTQANPK